MSKISKEGYEQIKVIRNALDSMYDKLNRSFYVKNEGKIKDIEKQYQSIKIFENVKDEFETIAGIVEESSTWTEAK
jgi:hypothetical protein